MLLPLACGWGSPRWIDFGEPLRFFDGFDPSAWGWVGAILVALLLGSVLLTGLWAAMSWRELVPVPQLANPLLEGATLDLARAVDLLRRADDSVQARALVLVARQKIERASRRLSHFEQRQLDRAWQIVRWSGA